MILALLGYYVAGSQLIPCKRNTGNKFVVFEAVQLSIDISDIKHKANRVAVIHQHTLLAVSHKYFTNTQSPPVRKHNTLAARA
jgi:hypothetical protein